MLRIYMIVQYNFRDAIEVPIASYKWHNGSYWLIQTDTYGNQ